MERAAPGEDAVTLTYLGVGGWIIERGGDQILTGPLFSNPSIVATGLTPVRSDTVAVDRYMGRYEVSRALAILVGHAHYDHLMDVPRVARRHAPRAVILGSETVKNTLGTWSGVADRVLLVDDIAGTVEEEGEWIGLSPGVRVMPLYSHHAAHFEGYNLYQGALSRPLDGEPRWASEWLDGETYAFLIDFLAPDGGVDFRVYYQDAVCAAPRGLAPESVIRERPVDVAIIVPATFDQVEWHPEGLIQNLEPRSVILGHWENFFRSPDGDTRSVVLTDMRQFQARLDRVHRGESWMPDLWTVFRFPVS